MSDNNEQKITPKKKNSAIESGNKNVSRIYKPIEVLPMDVTDPLKVSVSEAAKLGGVTTKTIRRAIQNNSITYTVTKDRYYLDFRSVILFLHTKRKLKNKLDQFGIGQYIREWMD